MGAAAAFFAGCGGSQPHVAPDFMPQNSAMTSAAHGKSWMQPGVKGRDLLYAAVGSGITVYTYPRGHLVGSLGVGGTYLCNDTAGNVFIPAGAFGTQILVYAHGATKAKATLNDPYPAVACSVDPTTERVDCRVWWWDRNLPVQAQARVALRKGLSGSRSAVDHFLCVRQERQPVR